ELPSRRTRGSSGADRASVPVPDLPRPVPRSDLPWCDPGPPAWSHPRAAAQRDSGSGIQLAGLEPAHSAQYLSDTLLMNTRFMFRASVLTGRSRETKSGRTHFSEAQKLSMTRPLFHIALLVCLISPAVAHADRVRYHFVPSSNSAALVIQAIYPNAVGER